MRSIDVYDEAFSESILYDSDDKLVDFWDVGGDFFDDVDVLMAAVDFFDQVAEVEGFEVLSLLVEIAWIVTSLLCVYGLAWKDKSFVVVLGLLVHIIIYKWRGCFIRCV
jgi:hypothetical protein